MVSLGLKLQKAKNLRKTILQERYSCSVQKKRSRKHQIFEKWDNFENQPAWKGYSPCKDYSLCKMVKLGQKLRNAKNKRTTFLEER